MKIMLKRILRSESGQALPMALILLVLGGLLVVPTLSFMTTSLNANRTINTKTSAIYAADAGIQDALWKLGNGVDPFPNDATSYDLKENETPVIINGMTVTVEKQALVGDLYTLRSVAKLNGEVKAVIVAQAVSGSDFSWLFDHAIVSESKIDLKSTDVIYGDIICGGNIDTNGATIYGDVKPNDDTVKLPTEAQLTAFYLSRFDDTVRANSNNYWPGNDPYPHPYTPITYPVSGGTYLTPQVLPWLYCTGDLTINGSGYVKLGGNIFVNGKFKLTDKPVILDLNGYTIYATYYTDPCPTTPNASNSAVYFGSDSNLVGPGCVIGVGHVEYQPNTGQGKYLFGADDVNTGTTTEHKDRFLLYKFDNAKEGKLSSIQVKCYIPDSDPAPLPAHVKVAIYADNHGAPGTLLTSGTSGNITVSSWAPVTVSEVLVNKNTPYWLAAIADSDVISMETQTTSNSKYQEPADFDTFTFVNNPSGTFTSPAPKYQIRGFTGGQEFIFLMSVKCTTNLKPNGSFYGTIAGNTEVNLLSNCFINLVGLPEEGLNFPGVSGTSSGPGTGGNSPPLLNYNIQ
ncbi:MAG: hypothetical protein WCD72_02565 [Dehalococcoidia bacterium]